ncbi:class B sortase [Butyrivibrio sp. DSM 10294]|uniref:class B sortase n=1 Tax=Butyrivibrio sp. DSM 10294 TaxID=2972457 RepID=UPI00234EE414|nr:class B sortase [Butyrivibrio sp. DSM 10294]MDC7294842.1 class B sortase [Butyrivibrio sp. DSM 10294]
MEIKCRYKYIDRITVRYILVTVLVAALLSGCGGIGFLQKADANEAENAVLTESAADSYVSFPKLTEENGDIFGWIYVPGTGIDYPVLQNSDGDDSFYKTHNALKGEDPAGAIYIEAANRKDMCDFNEVLHGKTLSDGTMFSDLNQFLDRTFFEDHQYIYIYTEDTVLVYVVMAAFQRRNTRLIEEYDFSYASGCREFIDEIYSGRSMGKNIRQGWEEGLEPENFIITLSTIDEVGTGKQTVVIGCLAADMNGTVDRVVDYSDPE